MTPKHEVTSPRHFDLEMGLDGRGRRVISFALDIELRNIVYFNDMNAPSSPIVFLPLLDSDHIKIGQ